MSQRSNSQGERDRQIQDIKQIVESILRQAKEKRDHQSQAFKQLEQGILSKVDKKENKWAFRLSIIGFLILFISWILQNYWLARWDEKRKEQDWLRSLAMNEDQAKDHYELQFRIFAQFYGSDTSDIAAKSSYLNGLANYCYTVLSERQIAAALMADTDNQYQEELEKRQREKFQTGMLIRKAARNKDIAYLLQLTRDFSVDTIYGRDKRKSVAIVDEYRDKAVLKSKATNNKFLISYIFGSCCLAISFIIRNRPKFKLHKKEVLAQKHIE